MKTLVKGSIAGAAGVVLLLGGAGTFALWNATTDVDALSVASGELTMEASGGDWDTAPTLWVPGDSYDYETTITISAKGDNIEATLDYAIDSATGDSPLLQDVTTTLNAVVTSGPAISGPDGTGAYTIDGPGTYVIDVTLTVDFAEASLNASQNQSIDFDDITFTLDQVAP